MSSLEITLPEKRTIARPVRARRELSLGAISSLSVLSLLLVWWAVTSAGLIEPLFLPSPQAVAKRGWLVLTQGYMDASLWQHLAASLQRIGLGLIAAVLTAIPLGIAIGRYRLARGLFDPLTSSTALFRRWPTCR